MSNNESTSKSFWEKLEEKLNNLPQWVIDLMEGYNKSSENNNGCGYGGF